MSELAEAWKRNAASLRSLAIRLAKLEMNCFSVNRRFAVGFLVQRIVGLIQDGFSRLGQVGYGKILEKPEVAANNRAGTRDIAGGVRRPKREVGAALGEPASGKSIQSSSKKLAKFIADNPDQALTAQKVEEERLGEPIDAGSEHKLFPEFQPHLEGFAQYAGDRPYVER